MEAEQKRELRLEFRKEREQSYIPSTWLHIANCAEIQRAQVITSYISYDLEPETTDLNLTLINSGKRVLLPRVAADNGLEWIEWNGASSILEKRGKIMEPVGPAISDLSIIDVAIVPALAVDRAGNRLGQGGGSYDRALSELSAFNVWSVAMIYGHELVSENLPHEAHDKKVSAAATPTIIVRF